MAWLVCFFMDTYLLLFGLSGNNMHILALVFNSLGFRKKLQGGNAEDVMLDDLN